MKGKKLQACGGICPDVPNDSSWFFLPLSKVLRAIRGRV